MTFLIEFQLDGLEKPEWVPYKLATGYSLRALMEHDWEFDPDKVRIKRVQKGNRGHEFQRIKSSWSDTHNPLMEC